ncbi:MAG: hypothetical protein ABII23_06875, partial [bacterium]
MNRIHLRNIIILSLLTIGVFANTFDVPFAWDDEDNIIENEYVTNPPSPFIYFTPDYWEAYSSITRYGTRYLPLRTLTFAIDYYFWKARPFGYHVTNLIFHLANVLLVYICALMLFANVEFALFGALIFAVHPMHVESVTWIKNRTDLITLIFYLLGLILYIKSNNMVKDVQQKVSSIKYQVSNDKNQKSSIKYQKYLFLLGSVCCYVLTLMSKEMGITLPVIILLYIICFVDKKMWKKAFFTTLPLWLVCYAYLYFKLFIIKSGSAFDFKQIHIGLYSHVLVVLKSIVHYVFLMVFPFSFNPDRSIGIPVSMFEPYVLVSMAAIVLFIIIAVKLYRRSSPGFFSFLWIFVTLGPVSNVFFIVTRPIAEQRLYIPSVGCALLGAWGLCRLKKHTYVMLVLLVSTFSLMTILR